MTIGFVGAGKVATTLARAFSRAGLKVTAAASRNRSHAQALALLVPGAAAVHDPQSVADRAELVFLTVTDDAIASICRTIAWRPHHSAVHCSGATPLDALLPAAESGARTGGFHPLQMFANPEVALDSLPGCAVGVEAAEPFAGELMHVAERIGCRPFLLPAGVRAQYHASATYVGPFVIAVLREATSLWATFGISEPEALNALLPLLNGTISAVASEGLARGMGGCVARGDIGTVRAHLAAVDAVSPGMGRLYRELTERTIPLGLERGTLTPERAEEIRSAIGAGR